MSTANVTASDVDYTQGGVRDLTQTTDGRLRVDDTSSGSLTITGVTLPAGVSTPLLPTAPGRKFLQISNTGTNTAVINLDSGATQGLGLAAGASLSFGFTPTNAILGVSASGTTLTLITG
jgi:hypothetical protein